MENVNSLQQLKTNQQITEMYKQQLHVLRSSLNMSKMMEMEYATDLDILQKKYDSDQADLTFRLKEQEEKFSLKVKELSGKVELLEEDKRSEEENHKIQILDMQQKVKQLEEQLKQVSDTSTCDMLKQLQIENNELREKEAELSLESGQLRKQIVLLTGRIEDLTDNLNEVNKCLSVKQEDLSSCMHSLTSARDEMALMKTELEMLQSRPQIDGQKGNSLFAEVEDKRQSMKKNLDAAINKYRDMKKLYMDKCAEASKFRSECVFLCRKWDEVQLTTQEQEKQLIETYNSRIEGLQETMQKLQLQKPPYIINQTDDATLKFIEAYAESSRKECKNLRDELEAQSVKALFSGETLFNTQRQLQRSEVELMKARAQITELQGLLQKREDKLVD